MNRSIATLLAFFILLTHSAWAMDIDFVTNHHSSNLISTIQDTQDTSVIDIKTCKNDCADHCSHSLAHSAGLFSELYIAPYHTTQGIDVAVLPVNYNYSQIPPHKPPRT